MATCLQAERRTRQGLDVDQSDEALATCRAFRVRSEGSNDGENTAETEARFLADVRQRLLIDTDTASDDAVALLMALRHPTATVEAITVVAGNVPLAQAVQNALYTRDLVGSDVPVYAGRARPRVGELRTAQFVHGQDGMGDIGLDLGARDPDDGDGVDVLIDLVRSHPGELTLVTLGPLTNVAEALERAPDIAGKLRRFVMMGGTADAVGNMSAVAEFNIWVDPEAAQLVFRSGAPIEMVGWDISRKYATFGEQEQLELRRLGPLGEFAVDTQATLNEWARQRSGLAGFDYPDPIAMAIALDASVATEVRRLHVDIEIDGALTRGQTVVDHLNITQQAPTADVVLEASRDRFMQLLTSALRAE
jgi:purine nucleosidase